MTKFTLAFLALVFLSCKKDNAITVENGAVKEDSVAAPVVKADNPEKINTIFLLVPGHAAGIISLGENAESLAPLGQPDLSDAAMGKAWMTWLSEHGTAKEELNIYTTYKDSEMREKVVRLVRVTSSEYKTKDSLGSGNLMADLQKSFPEIKAVAKYKNPTTKNEVTIFDAIDQGIAFEAEKDRCTAVIIHESGQKVTDHYLTLHPEMTRL